MRKDVQKSGGYYSQLLFILKMVFEIVKVSCRDCYKQTKSAWIETLMQKTARNDYSGYRQCVGGEGRICISIQEEYYPDYQ